jgi:hypothetical protein
MMIESPAGVDGYQEGRSLGLLNPFKPQSNIVIASESCFPPFSPSNSQLLLWKSAIGIQYNGEM